MIPIDKGVLGGRAFRLLVKKGNLFFLLVSANPHPSPTPACAQFQPSTLETGPNWTRYAPCTFPKGAGTFLGETIFRNCGA